MPKAKKPAFNRKERLLRLMEKAKKKLERERAKQGKEIDWKDLKIKKANQDDAYSN